MIIAGFRRQSPGFCVAVAICLMASACATTQAPVQEDVPAAADVPAAVEDAQEEVQEEAPAGDGANPEYSEAFLDYVLLVRSRIEASWNKPTDPKRRSLSVLLELDLDRSGRLISVAVARASGYDALDASAMEAVKKGDPYPPFPSGVDKDHLQIKLEMVLSSE